jgi:hypothetical protein
MQVLPIAPEAPQPTEISLRNAIAMRIGFLVAGVAILAMQLAGMVRSPGLQLFSFIGFTVLSGAAAVWLYRRRTGLGLSARSGARLGWFTGVFSFAILSAVFLVTVLLAGPDNVIQAYRMSMRGMPQQAELERVFGDPALLATALLLGLGTIFVMMTIAASIGGALGAKMLEDQK